MVFIARWKGVHLKLEHEQSVTSGTLELSEGAPLNLISHKEGKIPRWEVDFYYNASNSSPYRLKLKNKEVIETKSTITDGRIVKLGNKTITIPNVTLTEEGILDKGLVRMTGNVKLLRRVDTTVGGRIEIAVPTHHESAKLLLWVNVIMFSQASKDSGLTGLEDVV